MDFKTKRSLKRKAVRLYKITYILIGFFFLAIAFIVTSTIVFPKPLATYIPPIVAMAILVSFPFGALITMYIAQEYLGRRRRYLRDIQRFRARRFFQQILFQIQVMNDLQKAVDIYKAHNLSCEELMDDYLYGILIAECRHAESTHLREIASQKFDKIKATYSTDKIIF
jgi:hypothetical protein